MNRFFMEELRTKCSEISKEKTDSAMVSKVMEAYDRICHFSNLGRTEGLLALEEEGMKLDQSEDGQALFLEQIMLVVDGTEPELVSEMGANRCIALNLPSYLGLINLMYVKGSLMIQSGYTPILIGKVLQSMMPKAVLKGLRQREGENEKDAEAELQDMIQSLCDDGEPTEEDHTIIAELSKALLQLSDQELQTLLQEVDSGSLAVAMKGMTGKVRARLFENMSKRFAVMTAERIMYMGPVRMKDIEADGSQVAKKLLQLCKHGGIGEHDFDFLKVVLDLYDSAEKENKALRDKYKELKNLINHIYCD